MPDSGPDPRQIPAGTGASPRPGPRPAVRRSHAWTLLWAYIWLVYLAWPAADLFQPHLGTAQRLTGAGGLALFLASYIWMWRLPYERLPERALPAAAVTLVLAVWLTGQRGPDWYGLFIFAGSVVVHARPRLVAALGAVVVTAACVTTLLRNGQSPATVLSLSVTCALISVAQIGLSHQIRVMGALRAANAEIARLATVEERMRIARDVHDLLGHSLSVIALKADLARRLLDAGEAARAAAEITEVQTVARRSLAEVREAVAGYRRLRLGEELARVREALEAAGVRCAFTVPSSDLPEVADATLAWVVREAATNIVRHSGARACRIRIERGRDRVTATVEDDGRGPAGDAHGGGSGLAGLAERVRTVGGDLEAGGGVSGGFLVRASLPIPGGLEAVPAFAAPDAPASSAGLEGRP